MKIPTLKIKNPIKKLSFLLEVKPHKHWQFLLGFLLFISMLLIVFSFYLMIKIKNEDIFKVEPTQEESPVLIKENLLKELTEYFNQKELMSEQILNNPSSFIDPSI